MGLGVKGPGPRVSKKLGLSSSFSKGGRVFRNQPVGSDQKLPEGVSYKEYDIYPYVKGEGRGRERLVMGDDGSIWYTGDHYQSFVRLK